MIHPDEALLQELRLRQLTPLGRSKNRERTQYCSVKEEGGSMFAFRLREHRRAEIEAFLTLEPSSKPLTKKSQ
jgi:hypothetical protein